jgi:hypothetical protein
VGSPNALPAPTGEHTVARRKALHGIVAVHGIVARLHRSLQVKRRRGSHRYIESVAAVRARCCGGDIEPNARIDYERVMSTEEQTVSELASSPSNTAASANAGEERSEEQP